MKVKKEVKVKRRKGKGFEVVLDGKVIATGQDYMKEYGYIRLESGAKYKTYREMVEDLIGELN